MDMPTYSAIDDTKYRGVLPSRAEGKASKMENADEILRIAGQFMSALEYNPPPFPQDHTLRKAVIDELHSWDIGKAADGFLKCVDVGTAAAEVGHFFRRCV